MRVRAADEILNQDRLAVEMWREKQARAVALPTFADARRSSHCLNLLEDFAPICFRLAPRKVLARRVNQPCFIVEIEIQSKRVEPLKENGARIGFLFQNDKLIFGLRQLPEQLTARGIGRLSAFNAVSIKTRQPTLRRTTVRTMRMLLFAVEVRSHRARAG